MTTPARTWTVEVAPFWRRLIADLLDLATIGGIVAVLWSLGLVSPRALPELQYTWLDWLADLAADYWPQLLPAAASLVAGGLLYGTVMHAVVGRTLGELLLGLRVVRSDGTTPGPVRALLRALATFVGLCPLLLGYTWAIVDRRRQTLADHLTGTLLIVGRPWR